MLEINEISVDGVRYAVTDKDALRINKEDTTSDQKGLLVGQKNSVHTEVITLGSEFEIKDGVLNLALPNAEGASF